MKPHARKFFLLGSPFNFKYFFGGGVGLFGNIYVFIDIPFKGCHGRSNRSLIVHAVSYFACGVNDTACTVHAVPLPPHAFFIFLHAIAVLHMIFTLENQ
jgi:hypothetical protein